VFLFLFIYFLQVSCYVRPLLVFFQAPPYLKNKNEATAAKKKTYKIYGMKKGNIFPTAHKLLSLLVNSCSLHILREGVS